VAVGVMIVVAEEGEATMSSTSVVIDPTNKIEVSMYALDSRLSIFGFR